MKINHIEFFEISTKLFDLLALTLEITLKNI